jgi:molybdopterin-guanine dinucleotide biosynthesis protein A
MGNSNKALLPLAGKPLLQHVVDRVSPQVAELYLSVEHSSEEMARFGLPQLTDPEPGAGPLAGLLMAMQQMRSESDWLLLAPCDAPFIPVDLAGRLLGCTRSSGLPGAIVRYESEVQPTFSLWNRCLLPRLEQAVVREKMAGFKQFLRQCELAVLDWPATEPPPFFNINDQAALRHAAGLVGSVTGVTGTCSA